MIHIGIHTDNWRPLSVGFEGACEKIAATGVKHIESCAIHGQNFIAALGYDPGVSLQSNPRAIRRFLDKLKLTVSQIDGSYPMMGPSGSAFGVQYVTQTIRFAAELGCAMVDTVDGAFETPGLTRKEVFRVTCDNYRQCLSWAEDYKVFINVEPHGPYTNDVEFMLNLFRHFESDNTCAAISIRETLSLPGTIRWIIRRHCESMWCTAISKTCVLRWLVHAHTARANLVVTISEYSRRQVAERLSVAPARIAVCRPGVPSWIAGPAPGRSPGSPGHLLFVGTLEPRKNVPALLAAYRVLAERLPSAPHLVLAGQVTPAAEAWIAQTQAAPLKGRVVVEGYVTSQRRAELYAGASLVVLPSLDEGFGLPALEAMALGIPVVASSVGALPEVVADAGILIEPADVAGLAGALESVLTAPGLAGRMREAGIARSRQFRPSSGH